MRYFLDSEFVEDGSTIMPISIAFVREDGRSLYLEFPFDREKAEAHEWVNENVLPHLRRPDTGGEEGWIWVEIQAVDDDQPVGFFTDSFPKCLNGFLDNDPFPEFWAYYADYDWLLFCQRYGTMMSLPPRFPKLCMDLQQRFIELGQPAGVKPPDPDAAHDALADARWNLEFHRALKRYEALRRTRARGRVHRRRFSPMERPQS